MNEVIITRRGWIVIWLSAILIAGLFTYLTRDTCYYGHGYGSCSKLMNEVTR